MRTWLILLSWPELPRTVAEQVEINVKYEGYPAQTGSGHLNALNGWKRSICHPDFDYQQVRGLSREAVAKLSEVKPASVGQASRISGVTPADISVLLVYLEQMQRSNAT